MFSIQTCMCLTHSVSTNCEKVWVFAKTNAQSIITTALH